MNVANHIKIADHFLEVYTKFQRLSKEREMRLIITWPVMANNKMLDLSNKEHLIKFSNLRDKLLEHSIRIECDPAQFILDINLFWNTEFHTNTEGAILRSQHLGNCLKEITGQERKATL